ncbi:hypothetical protein [Acinetobacter calcoaceticus]|uniref:hypothetical protein n=1 Tax=Acinetobacter calcoaceticus TaxID=471 RepID=UPI0039B88D98
MSEFQQIISEVTQLQIEVNHLVSCTTKGLSTEQIAHLDERFFLAIKKLNWLKGRRDIRVFVWKPVSICNSQESAHRNRNQNTRHCRKLQKNT